MARRKHAKKGSWPKRIAFALLLLIMIYPFYEARNIQIDEKILTINNLPSDLKNLRIVYVSDIHRGPFFSQTRVDDLVALINSYYPDLVLLGGDYASNFDNAIRFFQNLPTLQARLGVVGVLGNHDRNSPKSNIETLKAAMGSANVTPLVNEMVSLRYKDTLFYIAGIDDYTTGEPDIQAVANQAAAENFVIFLTHTPDAFPEAFKAKDQNGNPHWFDLGLSGHTHGGQVTLFGTPIIRNYSKVSDRYLTGWLQENRAHTLVSNGVGTAVFPVRFFAKPQIHIITLQ